MGTDRIETRHRRMELGKAIPLPTPFTLRVDPCGACNFRCCFCPCNQSDYKAKERHVRMTREVFQRVLDGMKEWAARDAVERPGQELSLKVVDFHGFGEPLLNPLLPEMVRAVKEAHVCREIRLVTNGSLLTPERSEKLIDAGLDLCRISVYALQEEDYRRICGAAISPDTIVENVAAYHRLSRGTGSRISAKIVSLSLQTEADAEQFHRIYDPITDYSFIEEVGEIWPDFNIGSSNDGEHVRGDAKAFDASPASARPICTFPFMEMQIHADGKVSPCSSDWARKLAYGSVVEESLESLWGGARLRLQWRKHLDRSAYCDLACKDCSVLLPDRIDKYASEISSRL